MIATPDISTKNCPICAQQLPLSEFGVCRSRKDGRNLYCKSCIRKKVTDSRKALKEYRSSRKRYVGPLSEGTANGDNEQNPAYLRIQSKLSPVERVREAIKKGARTQKEIAQETRMGKDEIGDALANLILWTREIKTVMVDNVRFYSLNESAPAPLREDVFDVPQRKRDVPSSFSALPGLMPGKNPEGETEKIGGWVAA